MIKALEVSSNYEAVRPPKNANWVTDVYVVQRRYLRATTGRPGNPRMQTAPAVRVPEAQSSNPGSGLEIFEVDFEFKPEPLSTIEF